MEETAKVKRGGVIEVKQEWYDGHSLEGERRCCVKVCSPVDMFPPDRQDLRQFKTLSSRSVSNKTFPHINTTGYLSAFWWHWGFAFQFDLEAPMLRQHEHHGENASERDSWKAVCVCLKKSLQISACPHFRDRQTQHGKSSCGKTCFCLNQTISLQKKHKNTTFKMYQRKSYKFII